MAVYCLFYIFIAAYLYVTENKGSVWRWLYGALALLNLIILYFTATRGAPPKLEAKGQPMHRDNGSR
jgi:membrane-bound metal-dependent hydrolase YbcI (DUF457 family)